MHLASYHLGLPLINTTNLNGADQNLIGETNFKIMLKIRKEKKKKTAKPISPEARNKEK